MYIFNYKLNTNIGDYMINNYEIKEDVLYLYLDYSFEFSSEFGIITKVSEYIKNMKIKFKGTKIVLVVAGIAVATLFYNPKIIDNNKYIVGTMIPGYEIVEQVNTKNITNEVMNNNEQVEINHNQQTNNEISSNIKQETNNNVEQETVNNIVNENISNEKEEVKEQIVTVYRSNGTIINLNMTDYLIGVLGAEMPASFNIEALKAGAIASRTYALKKINNNEKLTDTVSTQAYNDNNELRNKWGNEFDKYYNKIRQAVIETDNLVITYNNELIDAMYFSTSNGFTESAKEVFGYDVPYLQSVESNVDLNTTPYLRTIEKETATLLNILGVTNLNNIEIISRTSSGRVKEVKIDNKIYTGIEIRNLLGLRSTDFDIVVNGDNVSITTKGYGHGVGMSQYGANELAKKGFNYNDIIKTYYQNVNIVKI